MQANAASNTRSPRLNPFAFPSDTDFRFVLLMVTVLTVSLFYYQVLIEKIPVLSKGWHNSIDACIYKVYGQSAESFLTSAASIIPDTEHLLTTDLLSGPDAIQMREYLACTRTVQVQKAAWIISGMLLLLATAAAIYWTSPTRQIRRGRLVPLSAEDAPEVTIYLANLCQELKLSRPPAFLWNPLSASTSGLAFGRFGQYYVALGGGLVTQFYTDLAGFRAVLLHELAHLKNADVDKTYFAMAIWQAFIAVALIPVMVTSFEQLRWGHFQSVMVLAALVYLMRNSILQARELYADARAAIWDGPQGSLDRVLASLPEQQSKGWRSIIRLHPAPRERRRILANPTALFRLNFWIAVATGIAVIIVRAYLENWMDITIFSVALESLISGLFLAIPLVGVIGLGVWRAAFAREALGRAPIDAGRLAFGVVLGILLGSRLDSGSPIIPNLLTSSLSSQPLSSALSVLVELVWGGLLFVVLFALLTWVAAGASTWLEIAAASRSPRPAYILYLVLAVGLFTAALAWLLVPYKLLQLISALNIEQTVALLSIFFSYLAVNLIHPIAFLAFASLWALPMSAWFWRRTAVPTSQGPWAYVESPLRKPSAPSTVTPLRPGIAVLTGLLTGLLYGGMLLMARIGLRLTGLSDAINNNAQYISLWFAVQIVLAILMQVGIAAAISGWARRLGWAHGLMAAFTAGFVMAAGLLVLNLVFRLLGGEPLAAVASSAQDLYFARETFGLLVNGGTLFALLPAVLVSAIAAWSRRPRAVRR